jgi:hypothetical protein
MNQEPLNGALEELTEETARKIIWTLAPGATSDPFTAVKQLLYGYLEDAKEQEYQDALQQQREEEKAQRN